MNTKDDTRTTLSPHTSRSSFAFRKSRAAQKLDGSRCASRAIANHYRSEPSPLAAVQGAALRTLIGSAGGGAAGVALDATRSSTMPARGFVDGTVNFNDVSSGIVLGFCLGLLWAAEEVLVGSDVISSIERRASAGLLCGRLVLIKRRASGCSRTCAAASSD